MGLTVRLSWQRVKKLRPVFLGRTSVIGKGLQQAGKSWGTGRTNPLQPAPQRCGQASGNRSKSPN